MNRHFFIYIFLGLAGHGIISGNTIMGKKDIGKNFKVLNIAEILDIKAIELRKSETTVRLFYSTTTKGFGYETQIKSLVISGENKSETSPISVRLKLPPPPNWDIAFNDKSTQFIYQIFGGATNRLALINQEENEVDVTEAHPHDNFRKPRFILGHAKDSIPPFVVIVGEQTIATFLPNSESKYQNYLELGTGIYAAIKPYRNSHLLFSKSRKPGIARRPNISNGSIEYVRLGQDFKPIEKPKPLLNNEDIFEFDVDVFDDYFVLFVTTKEGFIFAMGTFSVDNTLDWLVFKKISREFEMIQPSILVHENEIYLAVLQILPEGKQQLLTATISLDEFELTP
jgi:hypothetical protein